MHSRALTLIELLIGVVIVAILVSLVGGVIVGFFGGAFPHYSDGERTGVVYKLSNKGMIFKSYEGEMNLGGMATDGNGQMVPNRFVFSVKDKTIADQINAASQNGKRVTLVYNQYFFKPISIDTPYVINEVKTAP